MSITKFWIPITLLQSSDFFLSIYRDRTLDLELSLENVNKPKMVWSGSISRKLGLIEPAGSLQINLECIPFDTSLQVVSGVRLTDTSLKRTYNFDDFCHVYVTPELDAEGHDLLIVSRAA